MHVFLATDGSDSARAAQAQIALLPWRAPVHVTLMSAYAAARQPSNDVADRLRRDAEARARALVDDARQELDGKVESVAVRVHEGNPAVRIVEMARACRADLVAVGTRGHGIYKELRLGSVSDYVANHAHCPVLLARTSLGWRRRYLLALDDSVHAPEVVRWLGALDLSGGASVHLVKVFRSVRDFPFPDEEHDEDVHAEGSADNYAAWNSSSEVVDALRAQRLGPPGTRVTVEVRFGQEGSEILAALRKFEPDLLLIGAKGRNTHPDWPMGGVAQHLIDHSPCSVLVVRAQGSGSAQSSFR
ncbi:MAG: universal stress protein [Thermodesulfobacteriota bacterium]